MCTNPFKFVKEVGDRQFYDRKKELAHLLARYLRTSAAKAGLAGNGTEVFCA